jgi:hypothetical protein
MMVRCDASGVRLLTRNGKDWTVEAASGLKARSCLIDGEVVCCDQNGLSVFQLLRYRERPAESSCTPSICSSLTGRTYGASRSRPAKRRWRACYVAAFRDCA